MNIQQFVFSVRLLLDSSHCVTIVNKTCEHLCTVFCKDVYLQVGVLRSEIVGIAHKKSLFYILARVLVPVIWIYSTKKKLSNSLPMPTEYPDIQFSSSTAWSLH